MLADPPPQGPEAIDFLVGYDPRDPRLCRRVVQPTLYLILCHGTEPSIRCGSRCSAPVSATRKGLGDPLVDLIGGAHASDTGRWAAQVRSRWTRVLARTRSFRTTVMSATVGGLPLAIGLRTCARGRDCTGWRSERPWFPVLATTPAALSVFDPGGAGPPGHTTDLLPQRYVHAMRTLSTSAPVIPPGLSALPSSN